MSVEASFIVPTWNRAEVLDVSVPLFLGQDLPGESFEVVVVSDGPDARADRVMEGLAAPNLHYAALPGNSGPAAARNRAISMASGRILVFVDDDSLVKADFMRQHLRHHRGRDDMLVTGPIIDVTEVPDMAAPPAVRLFDRHLNPFPTGNASVAKAQVEAAGGFDEGFRTYGWEDPELYWRLRDRGLTRRFERAAPIYHFKPQATDRSLSTQLKRELARGRNGAVYYAKHRNLSVGMQTKQLPAFHALDRLLDRALGLEEKVQRAIAEGWEPQSTALKRLMLIHAEIAGGRDGRS